MQLSDLRKEIDYDTRDYTVDFLVQCFRENEFYIPDEYQRRYIWSNKDKNLFVESILLGLPIPFMFFSDTDDGRCEIIDGAQRTQTLEQFLDNDLVLSGLRKLTRLNSFRFDDLPEAYRRKFNKTTLRIVVLAEGTSTETRGEIFNRINTGGRPAKPIEIRRGSYAGPFMDFMRECSEHPLFVDLCPVSPNAKKRFEDLELVLRFFAYRDRYKEFKHDVDSFLDRYVEDYQDAFDKDELRNAFEKMLLFVQRYFPNGFRKTPSSNSTPRVRFEAISVGVSLALDEDPDLIPQSMEWLCGDDFEAHTKTHASNSAARLQGRIEYVRDALFGV